MSDVLGGPGPPERLATAGTGVVASGVRRAFGPVEAVRGIDLTAPAGAVTALVGPNGAGKTTLLLVLATLLVPDAGQVRVAGFDPVSEPDAVRARMGWSPDVFGLYDNLTCREYLQFVGEAYRLRRQAAASRAAELLVTARLVQEADRPVHTLSRGQKQRLGLARALVHDPEVLLLDEPASGLDPRSRVELRELLRTLALAGTAVVVSSHLLGDLEELADRVVFVDGGVTVGEHRIDELPGRPRRGRGGCGRWTRERCSVPSAGSAWSTTHRRPPGSTSCSRRTRRRRTCSRAWSATACASSRSSRRAARWRPRTWP
jgi:ABC-2 type transport system ATP-binding protein